MSEAKLREPALDPATVAARKGSAYPSEFAEEVEMKEKRALGDPLGLTQFGVNMVRLPAGAWSSQRHWHTKEDEFIYVLDGEITLVTEEGEQVLGPGMAAGFPADVADGHHLINRAERPAVYLEVGTRHHADECAYPDIDMHRGLVDGQRVFTRKDGSPFP